MLVVALVVGLVVAAPARASVVEVANGGAYARVEDGTVVLGNELVRRSWSVDGALVPTALGDLRTGADWAPPTDFELHLAGGTALRASDFTVEDVRVATTPGGVASTFVLSLGPGVTVERTVEVFTGVAGYRSTTTLLSTAPLALGGAVLDAVGVPPDGAVTAHSFRAGADWREPDWAGPQLTVGDAHPGTWRQSTVLSAPGTVSGQWVSAVDGAGRRAFAVLERNDQPSSVVGRTAETAVAGLDYSRDIVVLGPFEEQIHVENPAAGTAPSGRVRAVVPGVPFAFEPVFVGLGVDADDEAWQFHEWLTEHRLVAYPKAFVFNSNGTDSNRISTGAKDDLDMATIERIAPKLRAIGVDTFVLDDGWQAISGDWFPDSPDHREPRMLPPRFPDSTFAAVREAIEPMRLGLWMSPMHFHNESATYRAHPEWVCAPAGHGLALYNTIDPTSGSNEAGIGQWSPAAIPHVEARIRTAITEWQVEYFKFDFLAWLDCAGSDLYEYRAAFVAMLDRLQADFTHVTFQIDETNDYRLFPFESVTRGPSWFQNGTPSPSRLLHNIWNLSPWIPAFSLGQHVLGGNQWRSFPVSTLMAVGLLAHPTVFSDVDSLPDSVVAAAAPWAAFHASAGDLLDGVVYPLLDDPLALQWTALQSWDAEAGRGALLAFRQSDARPEIDVALRNVPDGTYEVSVAPDGAPVGTFSDEQLRAGLRVAADVDHAVVLTIERATA